MRNVKLTVAFDGTAYRGWQTQADARTIQGILKEAVTRITGEAPSIQGSGRTDAGVHARALVANFRTGSSLPPAQLVRALNSRLPKDIRVLSASLVPASFHARISAKAKIYRYQIFCGAVMPPHLAREHYHYPYPIVLKTMKEGIRLLEGEHDFASFAAKSGKIAGAPGTPARDRNTVRTIFRAGILSSGQRLVFSFEGSGFLHHMVRNLVGTLLDLGRGKFDLVRFSELLEKRDRTLAGFTAPAHGLVLWQVKYR
jgi:tRNA pseudouridine38-40 synthase